MKEYPKEHLGSHDLTDLEKVARWHEKKYPDEPRRSYMYCSDGFCVYTFRGNQKTLRAIDKFLTFYRGLGRFFGDKD